MSGYVVKFVFPPGGGDAEMEIVGIVGDGTLELEAAGTTDGARVAGTIDAVVFEPIF